MQSKPTYLPTLDMNKQFVCTVYLIGATSSIRNELRQKQNLTYVK